MDVEEKVDWIKQPDRVQTRGMLHRKNEYKKESLPVANHYPLHHPRYTRRREHWKKTKHSIDAEMMTKANRDIRVPNIGQSFPAQRCDSDNQRGKRTDHKPYDKPEVKTTLIDDTRVQPV